MAESPLDDLVPFLVFCPFGKNEGMLYPPTNLATLTSAEREEGK